MKNIENKKNLNTNKKNCELKRHNKLGFTLVELLGVIIILALISLIVFPSIMNQIKTNKVKISSATEKIIKTGTYLYLEDNRNTYGYYTGDIYCITLQTLVNSGNLNEDIEDSNGNSIPLDNFVKVTIGDTNKFNYEIVDTCEESNTTPAVPDDPNITPDVVSDKVAPVLYGVEDRIIFVNENSFDARDGVTAIDNIDGDITSKIIIVSNTVALGIPGEYKVIYSINDKSGNTTTQIRNILIMKKEYVFEYTGEYQIFNAPTSGNYKIELWGAQGGGASRNGAYTRGTGYLVKNQQLKVYVGSTTSNGVGGYNGGGTVTGNVYGGGGSTDIRFSGDALNDRVMVAAGGGGKGNGYTGGYGGTLIGGNGTGNDYGQGGSQISGGAISSSLGSGAGYFGKGGSGSWSNEPLGGGGSGYYGGSSGGGTDNNGGGGGGSSYISGYTGCVAITSNISTTPKSGCTSGTTDVTCSYHYSGLIFIETIMKAGSESMPTHDGTSTMVGNSGNGYAKITYIGE